MKKIPSSTRKREAASGWEDAKPPFIDDLETWMLCINHLVSLIQSLWNIFCSIDERKLRLREKSSMFWLTRECRARGLWMVACLQRFPKETLPRSLAHPSLPIHSDFQAQYNMRVPSSSNPNLPTPDSPPLSGELDSKPSDCPPWVSPWHLQCVSKWWECQQLGFSTPLGNQTQMWSGKKASLFYFFYKDNQFILLKSPFRK